MTQSASDAFSTIGLKNHALQSSYAMAENVFAVTQSQIDRLDSKQRVEEIARMLGGIEITATTRKHARELLAS